MRNKRQGSSNPRQCSRPEHGALPQECLDWSVPDFHVKIRIGRSAGESRNSARTNGGGEEDWRKSSAWGCLQKSSPNRGNPATECAWTRSDRDENHLAQRFGIPKPQCV